MKTIGYLSTLFSFILVMSCVSTKKVSSDKLYGTAWELETLNGDDSNFSELFRTKIPKIEFKKDAKRVQGNGGCNGYSADFNLVGANITFGEPGPSTMMFCGEGENLFRSAMSKVNSYEIGENDKLSLKFDDKVLLVFKKVEP